MNAAKLGAITFFTALSVYPAQSRDPQLGPHGGTIVRDRYNLFEVRIDKELKRADVYALRTSAAPPSSISLTVYYNPQKTETIQLSATSPQDNTVQHYEGYLSVANDSFVAVGITFNLSLFG